MEITSADDSALLEVRDAQAKCKVAKSESIFDNCGNRHFVAKLFDEGGPRFSRAGARMFHACRLEARSKAPWIGAPTSMSSNCSAPRRASVRRVDPKMTGAGGMPTLRNQMSHNMALVERMREIANRHKRSVGEVAIAWTLRHSVVPADRKSKRLN